MIGELIGIFLVIVAVLFGIFAVLFRIKFDITKEKDLIMWYSYKIEGKEIREFILFGRLKL